MDIYDGGLASFMLNLQGLNFVGDLFHYTNIENVDKILCKDKITFRMTNIDDFTDKMEGKSIEVFYDLALERLLACKKITLATYNELSALKILDTITIEVHDNNPESIIVFDNVPYVTYVSCFTIEGDSEYMQKNYFKNDEQKGCIIRLYGDFIKELSCKYQVNYRSSLLKVKYGKEVVEDIYKTIIKVLSFGNGSKEFLNNLAKPIIQMYLHELKYSAKLSRYKDEKEIRLVSYIPAEEKYQNGIRFETDPNTGKRYIHAELSKYFYRNIHFGKNLNENEKRNIKELLTDRGYCIMQKDY